MKNNDCHDCQERLSMTNVGFRAWLSCFPKTILQRLSKSLSLPNNDCQLSLLCNDNRFGDNRFYWNLSETYSSYQFSLLDNYLFII